MPRLWPSLCGLCMLFAAGCGDRHLEGAWYGSFPLAGASECRIRLQVDRRFDLSCQQDEWVGQGRYDRSGDLLILQFERSTRRGEPTPVRDFEFAIRRQGNVLSLAETQAGAETFRWERRLGGGSDRGGS